MCALDVTQRDGASETMIYNVCVVVCKFKSSFWSA